MLGVEAKVLPGGDLDISEEILEMIELLGIACHSFPPQKETYVESLKRAFKRNPAGRLVRVWLHPGLFFKRRGIVDNVALLSLAELAIQEGIYIEYNIKYRLPPENVQARIPPFCKIIGADAHSVKELEQRISKMK